jgi:hypothetical protein
MDMPSINSDLQQQAGSSTLLLLLAVGYNYIRQWRIN